MQLVLMLTRLGKWDNMRCASAGPVMSVARKINPRRRGSFSLLNMDRDVCWKLAYKKIEFEVSDFDLRDDGVCLH